MPVTFSAFSTSLSIDCQRIRVGSWRLLQRAGGIVAVIVALMAAPLAGQNYSIPDASGPKAIVSSVVGTRVFVLNANATVTGFSTTNSALYAVNCAAPSGLATSGAQSLTVALDDLNGAVFQTGQGSGGPTVVGRAVPYSGTGCVDAPALALGANSATAVLSAENTSQKYLFVVAAGSSGNPDTITAYYTGRVGGTFALMTLAGQGNLDIGGTYTSVVNDDFGSYADTVVTELRTSSSRGGTWLYNTAYGTSTRLLAPDGSDLPAVNAFIIHNPNDAGGGLLILVNQDGLTSTNLASPPIDTTPFAIIDLGQLHELAVAKHNPASLKLPSITSIVSGLSYYAMLGAVYNRANQRLYAVVGGGTDPANITRQVVSYDPYYASPETVVADVSAAPLYGGQTTQLALDATSGTLQLLATDSNRLFTVGIGGAGPQMTEYSGTSFSDTSFTPSFIASNPFLGETYIASTAKVDVITRASSKKMQPFLDLGGPEIQSAVGTDNFIHLRSIFSDQAESGLSTTNITITATPQSGAPFTFATIAASASIPFGTSVSGNFPSAGLYTLVATFPGDSAYAAATSAPVLVAVAQPLFVTSTTATGAFNSTTGAGVATVTLNGSTYVPTGTIQLTSVNTGLVIASVTLSGGLSNPITMTFGAPIDTTGIVATYSGDVKNHGSNSGNVQLAQIGQATPTITLTGPSTGTSGTTVAFNVKFTSASTATPTGNITIMGSSPTQNSFVVGALNASAAFATGGSTLTWTPTNTGTFTLQAQYAGDGNYSPMTVTVGTIVVAAGTYVFTLSSPTSATAASNFNITVNASPGSGATGNVTLSAVKQGTTTQIVLGTVNANAAANGGAVLVATIPNSGLYNISGAFPGDANFAASTSNNSPTIAISGGTVPVVAITPASATFNTAVGSTGPQQVFSIYNTGGVVLNMSAINVTGTGFSLLNGCPTSLQAGNSCTVAVKFSPLAPGVATGNLSITDNASGSPHLAGLTGIGTPGAAVVSQASFAFLDTTVGTSAYKLATIRLSNQGTAIFSITSVTLSNTTDFEILTNACGAAGTLTPAAFCDVAVEFHPTSTGAKAATLSFATSNSTVPQTTALSGNGLARGACVDSDGDGLCDDWETNGVYVRTSSTSEKFVDLPSMGADPKHKDIFVQADYMATNVMPVGEHSHQMTSNAAYQEQVSFNKAPVSNPDGTIGIHLHVDCGYTCVMDPVKLTRWGNASLASEIAEQTFLDTVHTGNPVPFDWTLFDQASTSFLATGRSLIFHHAIFAHQQNTANTSSGLSRNDDNNFGLGASDLIVSFGGWTSVVGTDAEQAGTLMHELGHNLALHHGGNDDTNYKPNYLSVMNYNFQTTGLIRDNGVGLFDYSRFTLPTLDETRLNEVNGVNANPALFIGADGEAIDKYGTFFRCAGDDPVTVPAKYSFTINGPINWDCDIKKTISTTLVKNDINIDGGYNLLPSFNDWPVLVYNGGSVSGNGIGYTAPATTHPKEITQEEDSLIPKPYSVAIQGMGRVHTAPNSRMTLNFVITNKGITDDTYTLSATMQTGWPINVQVPASAAVAAGKSVTVSVTYTVPSNAAVGDSDVLLVSAVSQTFPAVHDSHLVGLYATSTPFPDVVSTSQVTFGSLVVGSASAVQGAVILNTGTSTLSFGTIATTAEFAQTNTCGTSLAPGASCVVGVTFTPATVGARAGTLTINDGTGTAKTVALVGTGVAAALPIPSVTLTATPASTSTGQTVTFNMNVAGATAAVPTGTITIFKGTTQVGQATLDAVGNATVSSSTLGAGTYSLLATYSGDTAFRAASAPYVALTIATPVSTTVTLTSSAIAAPSGTAVTFTATLGGSSGTLHPTGVIRFLDGTTQIGTGTLDASGVATFATSTLANGTHSMTASYGGDSVFGASVSPALTESIGIFATTNKLTASAGTVVVGASVTLTSTLTATSGTPTGTVTFLDGTTTLGTGTLSGGVATYTTSALAIGTHSLTAQYAATGNFGASISTAVAVVVTGVPDFSISANPTSLSVTSGSSGTVTFTVTPANGYAGTLSLTCGTLPAYASCSFSPAKLTFTSASQTPQTSTLTFSTTSTTGEMRREVFGRGPSVFLAYGLPLGLLALGLGWRDRRRLNLRTVGRLLAIVAAVGVIGLSGCGGPAASVPTTVAGAYTVPINVTDGTTAHALSYSITVK